MLSRKHLLGFFGLAAIVAGLFIFGVGREFNTNWARWLFGPLLWFVGFAMVVAWMMQAFSNTDSQQNDENNKVSKSVTNGR